MQAFSWDASRSEEMANLIMKSADLGTVDLLRMKQSMGKLAPVFASTGVGPEEMMALVGTATQGGMRTQTAIAGLGQTASEFAKSDVQDRILEETGVVVNQDVIRTKGMAKVLTEINEQVQGSLEGWTAILGRKEAAQAVLATMRGRS